MALKHAINPLHSISPYRRTCVVHTFFSSLLFSSSSFWSSRSSEFLKREAKLLTRSQPPSTVIHKHDGHGTGDGSGEAQYRTGLPRFWWDRKLRLESKRDVKGGPEWPQLTILEPRREKWDDTKTKHYYSEESKAFGIWMSSIMKDEGLREREQVWVFVKKEQQTFGITHFKMLIGFHTPQSQLCFCTQL